MATNDTPCCDNLLSFLSCLEDVKIVLRADWIRCRVKAIWIG